MTSIEVHDGRTNHTRSPRGVWDEEQMCMIFPDAPVRRGLGLAQGLRAAVIGRNASSPKPHELTRGARPAILYAPSASGHGNFLDASYRRILARPEWARRLVKVHTARRQARPMGPDEQVRTWHELDAATSSDALLMNVFCYPRVWSSGLRALLAVDRGQEVRFGVRSQAVLRHGHVNTTEIDMQAGDLLIEAKLTEADFQFAPMRLLERYVQLDEVFDRDVFEITRRGVRSYQLIRSVLAAEAIGARFCILCDGRRTDLLEDGFAILRTVRHASLRSRIQLLTWQELAAALPKPLRRFLAERYGIIPRGSHISADAGTLMKE